MLTHIGYLGYIGYLNPTLPKQVTPVVPPVPTNPLVFAASLLTLKDTVGNVPAPTIVRNSTGTYKDYGDASGCLIQVAGIDQPRIDGIQQVTNLFGDSEDLTQPSWIATTGATKVNANTISFGVAPARTYVYKPITLDPGTYMLAMDVTYVSGVAQFHLANWSASDGYVEVPYTATTTPTRVTLTFTVTATGTHTPRINQTVPTAVSTFLVERLQLTNITNNTVGYAPNYVSSLGATSTTQLFDTTTYNKLTSGVIAEIAGAPLHPKITLDGADYYVTHPNWVAAKATAAGDTMNLGGFWHTATIAGVTGAQRPALSYTNGGLFTDGTVTWRNDGIYTSIGLLIEPAATSLRTTTLRWWRKPATWSYPYRGNTTLPIQQTNGTRGIDGKVNADLILRSPGASSYNGYMPLDTRGVCFSYFVRKNSAANIICFEFILQPTFLAPPYSTAQYRLQFDTSNGAIYLEPTQFSAGISYAVDLDTYPNHYRVSVTLLNDRVYSTISDGVIPAYTNVLGGAQITGLTGTVIIDWPSISLTDNPLENPLDTLTNRADEMSNIKWPSGFFPYAKGTMHLTWIPLFNSAKSPAAGALLVGLQNALTDLLYQGTGTTTDISSSNGVSTTTATMPAWNRDETIDLVLDWDSGLSTMSLHYRNKSKGDAWTHLPPVAYASNFVSTGFLQLLKAGSTNGSKFRNLPRIYNTTFTNLALEAKFI